eukprot:scaffold226313_cov21-Tisochrysis_lutea.AAC.1
MLGTSTSLTTCPRWWRRWPKRTTSTSRKPAWPCMPAPRFKGLFCLVKQRKDGCKEAILQWQYCNTMLISCVNDCQCLPKQERTDAPESWPIRMGV